MQNNCWHSSKQIMEIDIHFWRKYYFFLSPNKLNKAKFIASSKFSRDSLFDYILKISNLKVCR